MLLPSPVSRMPDAPPLRHLVEQLWGPALASGRVRLVTGSGSTPGWTPAERYLVLPSLSKASILLPAGPPQVLRGSVLNHLRLRRRRTRVQRALLGHAFGLGTPMPLPTATVEVADDTAAGLLPLAELASVLGESPLYAAIGVRTGANRKATLQLVDRHGGSAGFAKVAWNASSAEGMAREREALAERGVDAGSRVRVPQLVASGSLAVGQRDFLVTAPLPDDCRAVRGRVPGPNAEELLDLCPQTGLGRVAETGQFRALQDRVARLEGRSGQERDLVADVRSLVGQLGRSTSRLPVAARWHGDLTPWNCARDSAGTLWCWDWESSEPEAVAMLDAVHWYASVRHEGGGRLDGDLLSIAAQDAAGVLRRVGVDREGAAVVAALWTASVAERALALADTGPWDAGWVLPDELADLVGRAFHLLLGLRTAA